MRPRTHELSRECDTQTVWVQFTGRWLRSPTGHPHSRAYHSTLWPGNSVTILVFGEKVSLKLLPKPQGRVQHYSFVVSVDGGMNVRYNIDNFNTSEHTTKGYQIPIVFGGPKETRGVGGGKMLKPHTVRLTGISDTPISFEGLLVENTQVTQGHEWIEKQSLRPTIEFIGEGIDAERHGGFYRADKYAPPAGVALESPLDAIFSTVHYKLGEKLGVRHSHYSAGTCLIGHCDSRHLPGLADQYFYTSSLDFNGHSQDIKDKFDPRHIDNLMTAWRFPSASVPTSPVNYVVVDVGIQDLVMKSQNVELYTRTLAVFLARLRQQAHPNAKIMVIAHRGAPHPDDTILQPDFTTTSLRLSLYSATQRAVAKLGDSDIIFTPVYLGGGSDPHGAYLRAVCPHLLAPVGVLAKTKAVFGKAQRPNKMRRVCAEAVGRGPGLASGTALMFFVIMGLCVAGLCVARSTVIGAIAAVVGRKRLGMGEEQGRLLDGESATKSGV